MNDGGHGTEDTIMISRCCFATQRRYYIHRGEETFASMLAAVAGCVPHVAATSMLAHPAMLKLCLDAHGKHFEWPLLDPGLAFATMNWSAAAVVVGC
jgi:hypothetical protein